MTYVVYEISTSKGSEVVKTLAEAIASGRPYKTHYIAEPLRTFGGKARAAVSRSEYLTGDFARTMAMARHQLKLNFTTEYKLKNGVSNPIFYTLKPDPKS